MGDPVGPRRALVVARWYPSHDDPGRGSFVADHVRALVRSGLAVTVASFEPAMLRGEPADRAAVGRVATERWRTAVSRPDALNVAGPEAPGVPSVRVARLPVVLEPGERVTDVEVDAHADPLVAFGSALAEREGIDLIHAHTAVPDGLAAARLADLLAIPLVVTEHASLIREQLEDPSTVEHMRILVRPGRRLVAVSDHLARFIEERLGVPSGSVSVVPNAVPEDLFDAGELADAVAERTAVRRSDRPVLLWVGARKATKGTDTLIRAFAIARRDRPDLRLRLVGRAPTDDEEARLVALASSWGVAGAVAFDPPVPRAGVAPAMRRAALFVHPSPFETFGMVAAEALLVGLPVVATPSGVEAIVGTDGTCGEIAASFDAEDLAAAILRALDRLDSFDPAALRARAQARSGEGAVLAATAAVYGAAADEMKERRDRPSVGAGGTAAAAGPARGARPLIVCLNRTVALRSISRLPAGALDGAVVVTGPPTRQAPDPAPAGQRWIEHDPGGEYRARMAELTTAVGTGAMDRLRALRTSGARHREREAMAADRDGWIAAAGARSLDAARAEAAGPNGEQPFVVAVEAADVAAAVPLLDAGIPLAPGGLRWLADRAGSRSVGHP